MDVIKNIKKLGLVTAAAATLSSSVNAAIIEGNFTGLIYGSEAIGYADGYANSDQITGSFWYDTELVGGSGQSTHISYSFLGNSFDMELDQSNSHRDDVTATDQSRDHFAVTEASSYRNPDGGLGDSIDYLASLWVYDYASELLSDESLIQSFSWSEDLLGTCGAEKLSETCGYFFANKFDAKNGGMIQSTQAYLTSLDIRVRTASVPEPGSISLMLLGLLGLGAARKLKVS